MLKVPDFEAARAKVLTTAARYGAEPRDAKTQVNFAGEKHGEITLAVDSVDLDGLMNDARRMGKLYSESVQMVDRTSYYEKLKRRIALLGQNESELLSFLRQPRRMRGSDILFVQYRLFQTRAEMSDAAQELLDMERAAGRSLLVVSLFEPEPRRTFDWGNWHALAAYRAKSAFLLVMRRFVTAAYFVGWFAPFWIPAAALLYLMWRWARRRVRALRARRAQVGP